MSAKIYDISMPIQPGMPVYKNKPEKQPEFEITSNFPENSVRETRIHLDVHTGTHVDAPLHMMPSGDTIETIPLTDLIRPCSVLDLTQVEKAIHAQDLMPFEITAGDFILLKTRNSFAAEFDFEFVFLAADAAEYLAEKKIKGVGIDALGIERSQPEHTTHKALFGIGAVIIEGLQLGKVEPGRYEMMALPLKLEGLDASPARIVLRELK
ncbi:cyclase family protein [Alicyclobacillus sp. SO9]|uniref:cyclase family protein n=1 Tax=Alicyclobacillus sp. SO9 TaxID=2665646 RepID=UPI0018E7578B|nr:cyclase family protein [Alicyclobacillus sp. SO9]QQE80223.1 cyclase family protein [Alicyclobacillus sp. SO9]